MTAARWPPIRVTEQPGLATERVAAQGRSAALFIIQILTSPRKRVNAGHLASWGDQPRVKVLHQWSAALLTGAGTRLIRLISGSIWNWVEALHRLQSDRRDRPFTVAKNLRGAWAKQPASSTGRGRRSAVREFAIAAIGASGRQPRASAEQLQQRWLVGIDLLEGLALEARIERGNQPLRLDRFDVQER